MLCESANATIHETNKLSTIRIHRWESKVKQKRILKPLHKKEAFENVSQCYKATSIMQHKDIKRAQNNNFLSLCPQFSKKSISYISQLFFSNKEYTERGGVHTHTHLREMCLVEYNEQAVRGETTEWHNQL